MSGQRHPGAGAMGSILLAFLLAGCTLGPNFVPPPKPAVQAYVPPREKSPLNPAAGAIPIARGATVESEWWKAFGSPALDRIVVQALGHSDTLEAARQRLEAARQTDIANRAEPSIQLDASATISNHRLTTVDVESQRGNINLYAIGAQVSYSPDLFGAVRRGQEKLGALADYAGFEYQAARLSVAGNAAREAITQAGLVAQEAALSRVAAIEAERLALAKALVAAGRWPETKLAPFAAAAEQAAQAPLALRQQAEASRYALAALSGTPPALWRLPAPDLASLRRPAELPLSLPSALAQNRPDIRAAEAQVHAATADVGIATANLYPTLTISASTLLSLGGDIAEPLFKWDNLHAAKRASEASLKAALAEYRHTLLDAFAQVATVLRAIEYDEARLTALTGTEAPAAAARLRLARTETRMGRADRMSLLDAEREAAEIDAERAAATAALDRDIVELYLALGGGTLTAPQGVAAALPPHPPPLAATTEVRR